MTNTRSAGWGRFLAGLITIGLPIGCVKETSFRMTAGEVLNPPVLACSETPADTRAWLRTTHERLERLLPAGDHPALLTEDLAGARAQPADVLKHFRRRPEELNTFAGNLFGMIHTGQASGANEAIETPAPPWDGFEDLHIPIGDGHWINARLGMARGADGRPREADCIVMLPGILGDLAVKRTRDMAFALRDFGGQHVCAIELRGFGQTERLQPELPYNFGALETSDLLTVADWLQQQPHVRRTGLVGFCWSANGALLAAWEDGRAEDDPDVAPPMRPHMHRARVAAGGTAASAPCRGRHFEAGVMAFSPTVRFEEIVDKLDEQQWGALQDPALATLQKNINLRNVRKGYPERAGSLRRLIEREFARSVLDYPEAVEDSLRYLRLLPHRKKPAGPKLNAVRVPALIVHASNDILADPQAVAELIGTTGNPQVAALMLDGGGHVGFAPYAKEYFYNLLLAFFDEERGAAPITAVDNLMVNVGGGSQ